MLYLGNVLLRYVLIYNLEVSFNFHLTFLQLNVITQVEGRGCGIFRACHGGGRPQVGEVTHPPVHKISHLNLVTFT